MSTPAPRGGSRRAETGRASRVPVRGSRTGLVRFVVLVLVVGAGLALAGRVGSVPAPERRTESIITPDEREVVCPVSAAPSTTYVGLLPETGSGTVATDGTAVDLAPGSLLTVPPPGRDALTVTTTGAATRGIFADRVQAGGGMTRCVSPRASFWFTGAGASQAHSSTLDLSNPRSGPAVVDVSVFGADGPVQAPGLRGVSLKPGERRTVQLADVAPASGSLSVHVQVSRGLVTAAVEDSAVDVLDPKASRVSEWIPDQSRPTRRVVLVGLPPPAAQQAAVGDPSLPKALSDGAGLVLGNPGEQAVVVNVRLSTKAGAAAPAGLGPTTVPPESAVTVPLADLVSDPVTSVIVDADRPVTAGYVVPGLTDLVHAAPGTHWQGPAATALPPGTTRSLVLTADEKAGSVSVAQLGPQGKVLDTAEVAVPARSTKATDLLPNAASVVVTSTGTVVGTVLVVAGQSYSSLPLAPVLGPLRVPEVRPGF